MLDKQIFLSIFLIIDPLEHVTTHIILLGIEIMLDGIRGTIRKHKNKYLKTITE